MHFPKYRPRRLRRNKLIRELVSETNLSVKDLIMPLFVRPGNGIKKEILTMPGNYQFSVDTIVEEVKELSSLGIFVNTTKVSVPVKVAPATVSTFPATLIFASFLL